MQAHVPITSIRAQQFCSKWGAEKLGDILRRVQNSFVYGAFQKWQAYVQVQINAAAAEKYLKFEAGRTVVNMLRSWKRKKLVMALNKWKFVISEQREKEMQEAALLITRIARGYVARCRVWRLKATRCAVFVQCLVRRHLAKRRAAQRRLEIASNHAAVAVQKMWRGRLGRIERERRIQGMARQAAALMIQRYARGYQAKVAAKRRREDLRRGKATTLMQKVGRGWLARRRLEEMRVQRELAARTTMLQALIRGFIARSVNGPKVREWRSAIRIQAKFRAHKASEYVRAKRQARAENVGAVLLQKIWRGKQGRASAWEVRRDKAAQDLQRVTKGFLARKSVGAQLADAKEQRQREKAAIEIQTRGRGLLARKKAAALSKQRQVQMKEEEASRVLQRVARGFLGRRRARMMRENREWLLQQDALKEERRACATTVQRLFRGYAARKAFPWLKAEIERTRQATGFVSLATREQREAAAEDIQRIIRGFLTRRRLKEQARQRAWEQQQEAWEAEMRAAREMANAAGAEEARAAVAAKKEEMERLAQQAKDRVAEERRAAAALSSARDQAARAAEKARNLAEEAARAEQEALEAGMKADEGASSKTARYNALASEMNARVVSLNAKIASTEAQAKAAQAKVLELEKEVNRLRGMLTEKDETIKSMEGQMEEVKKGKEMVKEQAAVRIQAQMRGFLTRKYMGPVL